MTDPVSHHPGGFFATNRIGASLLLLLMGATWGGTISLAKVAVNLGGHPMGLVLWQAGGGGLLLLLIILVRRQAPPLKGRVIRFSLVCGLVGSALPAMALFWSARHLPAGVLSICLATMPLFTYGLSVVCKAEQVNQMRFLGVLLGFSGVALLILPESALPVPGQAVWVLVVLASSVSYAVENIYIALRRPPGVDTLALGCGRQLAGALIVAPLALATASTVPLFVAWGPLQWTVTAMALGSTFAYTTFLYVIRTAGPIFASQTAYLITIAGVLWGMAIFGERHSPWIWAALAVMLIGLSLVRPRGVERARYAS